MIDWETFKSQLQSDPGKMLKSVLLLAGCLFMIWLIVVMQSNPGIQQNVQLQGSGRLDSLGITKMQSVPEDSLDVADMQSGSGDSLGMAETQTLAGDSPTVKSARSNNMNMPVKTVSSRDNGFSRIFPTVLIFLLLIGGAWYWLRTQKKSDKNHDAGTLFTTVASQHLPGGPKLAVVKLNGEYWVMALGGPQGAQLLHRYSPDEWQGIEEKQQDNKNWKDTFLKTLNSSTSTASSQQKKIG